MTQKTPAYGARAAKAPVAPMTIERRDPGPHDVEIEILYCGICHSDMHKANDDWGNTQFPIVPGHEIVGRVVSQGARASRHREGDLVGVGCFVDSCRACAECRAGHEMFCEKGATFTFDSLEQDRKARTYGGYSANMVVDERYVLRVPKGLDPSRAAPLMCAGITTYSPLRQFGCKPGDQVAVMGLGGVGHMAVKLAKSMGAHVTVLSTSPGKEEAAARLGAKAFVATRQRSTLLWTASAPHTIWTSPWPCSGPSAQWSSWACLPMPHPPPPSRRARSSSGTNASPAPTSAEFPKRKRCSTIAGKTELSPTSRSSELNKSMTRTNACSGATCATGSSSTAPASEPESTSE